MDHFQPNFARREVFFEEGGESGPKRETEKVPDIFITAWYLRHGESSEDKTDPLRGLTEKGIAQVREAITNVTQDIGNKNSRIRLYSSGSERTRQQCIVAADVLHKAGFRSITVDEQSLPEKKVEIGAEGVYFTDILAGADLKNSQEMIVEKFGLHIEGPGIGKRIAELKASKTYMAQLRKLEADTGIGAVIHWLTDTNIPVDSQTPAQKSESVKNAVAIANRWAEHMRRDSEHGHPVQPIVALVFGHSSALTAYGADAFNWQKDEIEEIENAEGIKISLSGIKNEPPVVEPYGKDIEEKNKN